MLIINPPIFSLREYIINTWAPRKGYKCTVISTSGNGLSVTVSEPIKKKNWLGYEITIGENKVLEYWFYDQAWKHSVDRWSKDTFANKQLFILFAKKGYFDVVALLGEQLENEVEIDNKENMIFYVVSE